MSSNPRLHPAQGGSSVWGLLPEEALLLPYERIQQLGVLSGEDGSGAIDVSGLTVQQAMWMLNATSGQERALWRDIAKRLSENETYRGNGRRKTQVRLLREWT